MNAKKRRAGAQNRARQRGDARYHRSEKAISEVLLQALANRQINLKIGDICRQATISRPTFYAHCKNSDDALKKLERGLRADFLQRLPNESANCEVIFTILLGFMQDQKGYFVATMPNANFWLLRVLLTDLRPKLAKCSVNNKIYDVYIQQQIALLGCWVKYDNLASKKIPFYVAKLRATRLMDLGL